MEDRDERDDDWWNTAVLVLVARGVVERPYNGAAWTCPLVSDGSHKAVAWCKPAQLALAWMLAAGMICDKAGLSELTGHGVLELKRTINYSSLKPVVI